MIGDGIRKISILNSSKVQGKQKKLIVDTKQKKKKVRND
jgi:hypothetical protein